MVPTTSASPATVERARSAAAAVLDPEVPVLTIADLGVLRGVEVDDDGDVTVTVTPTYSGCPAMEVIEHDVAEAVRAAGFERVTVRRVLSPAWTTDWMSAEGRRKLEDYGIAPPGATAQHAPHHAGGPVALTLSVRCPQCGSLDTRETSRFGSTACKSLWQCQACREPFDHFKAI
ncbi:MAG TPA: 1,2-phenylacetyl-CoA epoxidase subunit PaaD [Actinomycetes bacterium]|nr:1,2-phenylacetyl-CoA epoxidase subunit PaaD [Actinomycetes bacterium]